MKEKKGKINAAKSTVIKKDQQAQGDEGTILSADFFDRPVLEVAPQLLGKYLVKASDDPLKPYKNKAYMITEVEAYDGPLDLACHASKGRTRRTETLFGKAGHWYVYLIYGIYSMLNVVCEKEGYPAGVLIRGIEGFDGPGKVTKALGVDRSLMGKIVAPESGLWIEDRGVNIPLKNSKRTPRIGVEYAGPVWSKKRYRFLIK